MEMSIDEAISWLNTDDYESKGFEEATSVAIETMRRYQRIEEIIQHCIDENLACESLSFTDSGTIEVIEDGNDD
jgi:hypothetical protein